MEKAFPDAYVMSVYSLAALQATCAGSNFELVILGQSLSDREKLDGEAAVRLSCKNARIVEMYNHFPVTKADLTWHAPDPADAFAKELVKLMNDPEPSSAAL